MGFWRGFARPGRYAALLAGGLPVLAFPAPNLEFVAWFGLLPGLFLLRAAPTGREAAIRGWWFGAGYLLAALYWLTPNLGPALLLVVIVLGAPWTGVGYAAWRLLRGQPASCRRRRRLRRSARRRPGYPADCCPPADAGAGAPAQATLAPIHREPGHAQAGPARVPRHRSWRRRGRVPGRRWRPSSCCRAVGW